METTFNEQESLKTITEMIENSKARFKNNGFFFLLWGWLVFASAILNFVFIESGIEKSWLPWVILMPAGLIISFLTGYKKGKKAHAVTHFDKAMIYLWNGFIVVLAIIMIMAANGLYSWETANILIVLLYGLGIFVSGGLLKFFPLIAGGVACWIIAPIMMIIPGNYSLLLLALSVVIAYLIPGYILKSRVR